MNPEYLLSEIKRIVVATKNPRKILHKLSALGFSLVNGKCGHYHLRHPLMGSAKVMMGCSPSDYRWPYNFVREIRHAIWSANKVACA